MNVQNSESVRIIRTLRNRIQQFVDIVTPHLEPVARGLAAMAEWHRIRDVLNAAGWLPHYTTPLGLIADCLADVDTVRDKLEEYYAQNWPRVRTAIECRMTEYNVDEEAKATFREALEAHSCGLHRSVCRLLFPEIDRVLRTEVFGRKTGRESYKKIVETLVSDKTLDDFLPGGWIDFDYFGHLTEAIERHPDDAFDDRIFGLFRPVTEDDLQRLEQDPVPNRHAAMHGYVSYSSPQNSLNAIFVADYMFRLISSFRNAQTASE